MDCGHPALDYDAENTAVCDAMVAVRGPWEDRHNFIAGPSTSNRRMERRWRDVFPYVFAFLSFLSNTVEQIQPVNGLTRPVQVVKQCGFTGPYS